MTNDFQSHLSATKQQSCVLKPGSVAPGFMLYTVPPASQYLFLILLEAGWDPGVPEDQLWHNPASLYFKLLPCFEAFTVLCTPGFLCSGEGSFFY